ncbi:hypothetical protein K1X76_08710 [bacterium]|nr:hypothetical protein [bacterium]
MKQRSFFLIIVGFISGIFYITACGGGTQVSRAIADAIGNAADVIFDNSGSGMTATDTQSALDELDNRLDRQEPTDLTDTLVGTWSGTYYVFDDLAEITSDSATLTFNENGSYSCTIDNGFGDFFNDTTACDEAVSWDVLGNVIVLTQTSSKILLSIDAISSTKMNIRANETHWLTLTKS